MSATLSPTSSPRVRRRGSTRRPRAGSHLPPFTQESHDAALYAIRTYLKGRTSYDTFPVSFRLIVLDSKLEVKKALQCLLLNGISPLYPTFLPESNSSPPPVPKVSSPHHSGTAKSPSLRACSPSQTSYISSSTTTSAPPTMLPPPMSRPSG